MRLSSLLLIALLAGIHTARADDFEDFKNSRDVRKLGTHSARPDSKVELKKWFPKNNNFSKVFIDGKGAALLVDWLGTENEDYKASKPQGFTGPEQAEGTRAYLVRSDRKKQIDVRVIVPHPRSMLSREMNLLNDFRKLETDYKLAEGHEEVKIHERPATVAKFEIDENHHRCGVLMELPQKGIMEISMKDCGDPALIVSFAETLDIPRLCEKLES